MCEMKPCTYYEKDDIGIRYGTKEAREVLNRDEALLSEWERALRRQLEEFEAHFLQCDECLRRVREHQDIEIAWSRMGI